MRSLILFPLLIMVFLALAGFSMFAMTWVLFPGTIIEYHVVIDPALLFIGILVSFSALAILASLQIFGSGISGVGVHILFKVGFGLILWFVLSGLSYSLIFAIPYVGIWVWCALTLMYVMGWVFEVQGRTAE